MEQKNVINVLIAVPKANSAGFIQGLKSCLQATDHFQVLNFYTAYNIETIDQYVAGNKVDILICAEELEQQSIGQGSMKRWQGMDDALKIVLILQNEKRGGRKVHNFLKIGYFNGIFLEDLTPELLLEMCTRNRTESEAEEYYYSESPSLDVSDDEEQPALEEDTADVLTMAETEEEAEITVLDKEDVPIDDAYIPVTVIEEESFSEKKEESFVEQPVNEPRVEKDVPLAFPTESFVGTIEKMDENHVTVTFAGRLPRHYNGRNVLLTIV